MYGIIRYPSRHNGVEIDPAIFDGWYRQRSEARMVYADWCVRFPDDNVSLVLRKEVLEAVSYAA